jgi:hypothetical protein
MRTQQQVLERIAFLENQLNSLEHFLPETYSFLMEEMDVPAAGPNENEDTNLLFQSK